MRSLLAVILSVACLFAFHTLAAPVSAPEVAIARNQPVSAAQFERYTKDVGTTPVHAFNVDLTVTTERVSTFMQDVRISNRHATNGLCWLPVTFATSCAATCAASAITCDGTAATDGDFIAPGSWISMPITGLDCACVVASAASTRTTGARVKRAVQRLPPRRRRERRRRA